jgi:hypothetical protein
VDSIPPHARCCAAHPDADAVLVCDRCGSFACTACVGPEGPKRLCKPCHKAWVAAPASRRARVSLFLATAGFVGFVPGVVGLVLAKRELAAIARLDAPLAGEDTARMAKSLGWFHVFMLTMVVAGILYRLAQ